MSTSDWIAIFGIAAGLFVTIIGSTWHLSHQISNLAQRVTNLEIRFDKFEVRFEKLEETVNNLRVTVAEMLVRLDILWRRHIANSNSPIALNESGLRALEKSNIGAFANDHYTEILSRVRAIKPDNAYEAQEALISVVNQYKRMDEYRSMIQQAAYFSGYDIDPLLFAAALSIRDRVIEDLGFANERSSEGLLS